MPTSHAFSRASPAAIFSLLLLLSATAVADLSPPVKKCSKTCVAENCSSVGIRYGKYCGVGWSGCPGEKPCDDLDECCRLHDDCVEKKGIKETADDNSKGDDGAESDPNDEDMLDYY